MDGGRISLRWIPRPQWRHCGFLFTFCSEAMRTFRLRRCRSLIDMSFAAYAAPAKSWHHKRLCRAWPGTTLAAFSKFAQGITLQPVHRPLVLRHGAGRLVEIDGRRVPVQHRPLETATA